MNELRWYLLAIGAAILLLIYLFGRKRYQDSHHDVFADNPREEKDVLLKGQGAPGETEADLQPVVLRDVVRPGWLAGGGSDGQPRGAPPEARPAASAAEDREVPRELLEIDEQEAGLDTAGEPSEAPQAQIVVMHVVAPKEQPFAGKALLKAFHVHGLRFGELQIFHRLPKDGAQRPIFSVANIAKPGTLIPEELVAAQVPGLTLFMQLPTVVDAVAAYDEMVHCAQHLASVLGGKIMDAQLNDMTPDMLSAQREQLKG